MDQKPTYSVEDILREYELKKSGNASDDTNTAPVTPAPRPIAPPVREFPSSAPSEDDDAPVREFRPLKPVAKPQKKVSENTRRLDKVVPTPEPKTVAVSTRTRVLTVAQTEEKYQTNEIPLPDQLEGQMVMENFSTAPIDEEKLEEELRRRRQEKIDGFRIVEGGKAPLKLTGEEEETDPEEEQLTDEPPVDDEELEDFNDYAESEAVYSELAYRRRMGAFAVIATGAAQVLLLIVMLAYQFGWLSAVPASVLTTFQLILMLGMLGLNHRMLVGGIKKLLKMRADTDTPVAIVGVIGTLYTALLYTIPDGVSAGTALLLSAGAGMGVLAGRIGRQMQIMRISRNFTFVGSEKTKKYAAAYVDDEKIAAELGRPADIDGIPPVMYYRKASLLTKFLERSYAPDPVDQVMRWFVPLTLGIALLCTIGYVILFPTTVFRAVTVFAATVITTMPVWAMFSAQRAFSRSCKRALKKGAMIAGFDAVTQYGHRTKAVIVDAGELFQKEQVKLHGIKTFSGTRIDEAITDAAAVVIAAGGPLAPIFQRLIENRTDILREVDSLAYEQDMGLSGWVGGRRVLIGNRRLLANHGVEVPSKEYEDRYTKDDRNTVYLSTGGELSAMFVVSYLAAASVKTQLRALQKEHIQLLVRTCDPNVTADLICRVMELPPRSVEVLSAGEGRAYDTLLASESGQEAPTSIACTGRAVSKLHAVVQCCRLRRGVWAGLISQLAFSVAAMVFAVFVSAVTGQVLRADALVGLLLLVGIVGHLVPRLFRT